MSRVQYSFTFTNAQQGAQVHLSRPGYGQVDVYATSDEGVANDDDLYLDSDNSVSVWADVDELDARTIDGRGKVLELHATRTSPTKTSSEGFAGTFVPTVAPGVPVIRKFPFAYNTPGLVNGHSIYTPTVGDILLDAWIQVLTPWDGTNPQADIGTYLGGLSAMGLFLFNNDGGVDLTKADSGDGYLFNGDGSPSLAQSGVTGWVSLVYNVPAIASVPSDPVNFGFVPGLTPSRLTVFPRMAMGSFITDDPLKLVVTQDATPGGASPGATQGEANLFLITATPVTG